MFSFPPSRTVSRFWDACSLHWNPSAPSVGSTSRSRLRRSAVMVLPHSPKAMPSKQAVAHRKKASPMHRVFPLRTAPSQITASGFCPRRNTTR